MEKYPRGRRGSPAKGVVRDTVARVQIPLSPPSQSSAFEHKKMSDLTVTRFFIVTQSNRRQESRLFLISITIDEINLSVKIVERLVLILFF